MTECKYCGGAIIPCDLIYVCSQCGNTESRINHKMIKKFNKLSNKDKMKLILGKNKRN